MTQLSRLRPELGPLYYVVDGNEYYVRAHDDHASAGFVFGGKYFCVEDVAKVLRIPNLKKMLLKNREMYCETTDYKWFGQVSTDVADASDNGGDAVPLAVKVYDGAFFPVDTIVSHRGEGAQVEYEVRWVGFCATTWEPREALMKDIPDELEAYHARPEASERELYISYNGVVKLADATKSAAAVRFRDWVYSVLFPARTFKEEKVVTTVKALNADADHLRAIMSKCALDIICLYIVDTLLRDGKRRVLKYGFSKNLKRRFSEHMKTFGESASLEMFVLVPETELSKAEATLRNSISSFSFACGDRQELISVNEEEYRNVKTILRTISGKCTGNMASQIAECEKAAQQERHAFELQLREKDMQIMDARHEVESHKKEIEILNLKMQLLEMSL